MAQPRINDWDQLYPGRFFKGGDIAEGEKKVVKIIGVDLEPLEGDKGLREKGILTFEGEKMQLALNKTNGICLREMFGRKPYEWIGKRFAMFQSEWQQEPCIRIWGSPDIADDIDVWVDLGRRRKPFKMTMHAMKDQQRSGVRRIDDARPKPETLSERCQELLKLMGGAKTFEDLMDIEADLASETFNERETRLLDRALAKRREQLDKEEAKDAAGKAAQEGKDDEIPFR